MRQAAYLLFILVAALFLVAPHRGETAPPPVKTEPAKEVPLQTAPVMLGRSPIFSVPAFHALSAEERASRIGERITKIAEDLSIRTTAITSADSEVSTDVMAGERVIMSVYDSDARPFGVTRQQLATVCAASANTG